MPKIKYENIVFRKASLELISLCNEVISSYQAQGFSLTLRQLYYQMVTRNVFPNTEKSYNNLGVLITNARMAGLVDWEALEDRTRFIRSNSHWDTPGDIIASAAYGYRLDLWSTQPTYVEVWIEKDALVGVLDDVCKRNDVPYFSCRGYTSASEMWVAAQRIRKQCCWKAEGAVILHLGDHDPSGIDMTRDITDRLATFSGGARMEVRRIALTWEQIQEFNPPPNPAKLTDTRAAGYIEQYGTESWELDALSPQYIVGLIETELSGLKDAELWDEMITKQEREKETLNECSRRWDEVVEYLA